MSRGRGWVQPVATDFRSEKSEFRTEIDMQLQEAVVPKPSGRLELNSRLGYPDFEPAPNAPKEADEDRLDPKRLRDGYCDPAAGLYNSAATGADRHNGDEHGSME
eukprot:CAMPEP_0172195406 /NCGR_PEP_ID=MMETSP1050-20130122/26182_1 /TAXON_ID=233186 /ORGANISM="Cryptomonas curvata, Strain CCAP979/52" /LENGTH=104 /DNA_ID=CAMNT_0012871449 /DNA_START=208 /DNA_END=519 /DNA_ORIENTATION=+